MSEYMQKLVGIGKNIGMSQKEIDEEWNEQKNRLVRFGITDQSKLDERVFMSLYTSYKRREQLLKSVSHIQVYVFAISNPVSVNSKKIQQMKMEYSQNPDEARKKYQFDENGEPLAIRKDKTTYILKPFTRATALALSLDDNKKASSLVVLDVRENLINKIKEGNAYTIFYNSFGQNVIRPTEAVKTDIKLTNEELVNMIKQYSGSLYISDNDANASQKIKPMNGFSLLNNVYIFDADIVVHDDDYSKFDIVLGKELENPLAITCSYRHNLTHPAGELLAVVSVFGTNNNLGTVWGLIPINLQGQPLPAEPINQIDLNEGNYEFPAENSTEEVAEQTIKSDEKKEESNDGVINPFV